MLCTSTPVDVLCTSMSADMLSRLSLREFKLPPQQARLNRFFKGEAGEGRMACLDEAAATEAAGLSQQVLQG